ncbi:type IV pilin N-terminal domain-containing protein [uncultured Methanofollis sp.]|uniref:type IV pilin N-terminal domain-containing protein n=1 Tax=uncultured Methanofollis sp. TaxID=262500 RepID=UPI00262F64E0|nr:type IV pilin N-terminal domain-containing protein [uncultured Methanofollis sp.]
MSEVIGVMLMISVTLIIVALVAVYATGAAGEDDQPVRADLIASEVVHDTETGEYMVVFEHMAGDPLALDQVQVSLGVRDDATQHVVIRNGPDNSGRTEYFESFSGDDDQVHLGDRFVLYADEGDTDGISWGEGGGKFTVESGHYLTYRFIDRRTGAPISSGEIMIPYFR